MDPVMIEVLRNELAALTDEMSLAIRRLARSPMVRVGDFGTGVASPQGLLVEHPKVQAGVMLQAFMTEVVHKYGDGLKEGDVVVGNDPFHGGSHKPDVFVVSPAFLRGAHVGYATAYSHQIDVGGRFPGGTSSRCAHTYEEGIHVPNVRLYREGELNEGVLDMLLANLRQPEDFLGDLDAKVSGSRKGATQLAALHDRYGSDVVLEALAAMDDASERLVRRAVAEIPDGEYDAAVPIPPEEDGSVPEGAEVRVVLRISGDSMVADFTGTAGQMANALNLPESNARAIILRTIKAIVMPSVGVNTGFNRPITLELPPASILSPRLPAAVGGRTPLFFVLAESLHAALAKALPGRVPVPPEGADAVYIASSMNNHACAALDVTWGGWGARPERDGVDGVALNSNVSVPVEVLERTLPVVVDEIGFVEDSAGPGRYRGSMAVRKTYRFLADANVLVRTNRPYGSADGYEGGQRGMVSLTELRVQDADPTVLDATSHRHLDLHTGDVLTHVVGATSGYGRPEDRAPELVLRDVVAGKLSPDGARRDYAVVIDPTSLTVDDDATRALREERG